MPSNQGLKINGQYDDLYFIFLLFLILALYTEKKKKLPHFYIKAHDIFFMCLCVHFVLIMQIAKLIELIFSI